MKSAGEFSPSSQCDKWIPLIETSAREVLDLMLGCQLTVSAIARETTPPDVTAMVGLAGQLRGVFSVRCDGKVAVLMASKMLGVVLDKVGPEVADVLGEVCNMVAGNFKNKIVGLGHGCLLSPPTIVTGSHYNLCSKADSAGLAVTLLFDEMPIVISLQIHS
jgi:chemotaxis protein CheX